MSYIFGMIFFGTCGNGKKNAANIELMEQTRDSYICKYVASAKHYKGLSFAAYL